MTDAVLTHGALGPDSTRRVDGSGPPPGVEVSPQSMVVPEGGSAAYTMVLRIRAGRGGVRRGDPRRGERTRTWSRPRPN